MQSLKANPDIIVVDNGIGANSGSALIKYEKERWQELWERPPASGWSKTNVHVLTGQGDIADTVGEYPVNLKPGDIYEVGIFEKNQGPINADPIPLTKLKVFCLWKKPKERDLIIHQNRGSGGTWHLHQIATKVPTNIVSIGVSQKSPFLDADGIPRLKYPEGAATAPFILTQNHLIEINPLLPGNHYFFIVVVTDSFGNWDMKQEEFDTLRRKLTVEFPTLHIYNDGDPNGVGEGEFWFTVYEGDQIDRDFHLPTQDIDDWGETDRPYPVGFAYLGMPKSIEKRKEKVKVMSTGIEHDGILESDEGAGFNPVFLPIPSGRFVENVKNQMFLMDCPTSTVGDDFHYGVEVRFSVEYVP